MNFQSPPIKQVAIPKKKESSHSFPENYQPPPTSSQYTYHSSNQPHPQHFSGSFQTPTPIIHHHQSRQVQNISDTPAIHSYHDLQLDKLPTKELLIMILNLVNELQKRF